MAKDEYESLLDKSSDILSKSNISEERLKIPRTKHNKGGESYNCQKFHGYG
jgi:hypothetical protein